MANIGFISLGCAKNQVNCEQMMATCQAAGHHVTTNPDGADVLKAVLENHKNAIAIVGVMRDKNYQDVLSKTLPLCENVICVKPNVPRALPVEDLANGAKKYCKNVFVANDLQSAIRLANKKSVDNSLFVFGSLYLASEIRSLLRL